MEVLIHALAVRLLTHDLFIMASALLIGFCFRLVFIPF
jgi:hypothetical protein